ncbi:MAG TPA: sulfatase [Polyangiaceae bacterium]|nr:sulfatase [Polyangiaceae bacterium]
MKGSIARAVFSVAGAVFGAEVVGVLEAVGMRGQAPLLDLASGDAAVIVPIASALGLAIAGLLVVLDPGRSLRLRAVVSAARRLEGDARAKSAAAALVTPPAMLAWALLCAHGARTALGHGSPAAVGFEMATLSVSALAFVAAAAVATVQVAARTVTAGVGPIVAGACGVSFAVACSAVGARLGDASGNGPTPLAILGVLTRRELDLSPVLAMGVLCAFAVLGERVSRYGRGDRLIMAGVIIVLAWGLVLRQAYALADSPGVARAIELGAPLGRVGLSLARRATDRDGDGVSYLFGGGDCDDADPRRSPLAVDIPGNGVDEDCSGADLPLPQAPPRPPRTARASLPSNLNVMLITVDTLRIDLGFMGYERPVSPNLDALAARSTVFERAYAMASYTGKSVGPTLIGKYPSECVRDGGHFNVYGPSNKLVTERLQDAGFHTMGAASHWYFKPKYGLAQGMDIWDLTAIRSDSEADSDSTTTSEPLTDAVISMLTDPVNVEKRFFLWAHYFDPHAPYVPHPEAPDFRPGAKSWGKPLYDGEVWYTDHHIGRLLDFVASQPWGQRTAIIVTADHGEAFDEHGMNWHGGDVWEPLVRVPLVVYVPGAKAHRVKAKRSLIDLVPTVLDLMAIPQPPAGELSGQSMISDIVPPDGAIPEERDVFMDVPWGPRVSQHRALIHGPTPGLKLMHEGGALYLLFDLSRDPGELTDLSRSRGMLSEMIDAYQQKLATLHEVRVDPSL